MYENEFRDFYRRFFPFLPLPLILPPSLLSLLAAPTAARRCGERRGRCRRRRLRRAHHPRILALPPYDQIGRRNDVRPHIVTKELKLRLLRCRHRRAKGTLAERTDL